MELVVQIMSAVAALLVTAGAIAGVRYAVLRWCRPVSLRTTLQRHFKPAPLEAITTTERKFPIHVRPDLQLAMDDFLRTTTVSRFLGVRGTQRFDNFDFTTLFNENSGSLRDSEVVGPPQYEQVDIGADEPMNVLQDGLWLLERQGARFAILYTTSLEFGGCGYEKNARMQVATTNDEMGAAIARIFFRQMEAAVSSAQCYRGKILSFESEQSYNGRASGLKVHRLGKLERDQVILPAKTLELLDRNAVDFVARRPLLGKLHMATKKGLLFYGPPGTGKTHTIRYLAGALKDHTTLLISAEQVTLLSDYMSLARLLQPCMVVVEDVDLIARERGEMNNASTEALLNKLLNEMDGLKEDCEILFVLTTNHPEDLEAALASRPGRVDQAIEFPLPDEQGRGKLVRLYARGLPVSDELVEEIVKRTTKVSASFIKELMRRAAQYHLANNGSDSLALANVESALDEMIFSGGSLNMRLLGAEARTAKVAGFA